MAVIHIYTDYIPGDPETKHRMSVAQSTWKCQPWHECPVRDEQLPRLWKEEGRQFAYIKDVFDFAAQTAKPEDIICYTNADICVRTDCTAMIAAALQGTEACFSYRRDFPPLDKPIPDSQIQRGQGYPGSDLKAFRKRWWQSHRKDMADMILGMEAWDPIMRTLIEDTNQGCYVNIPDTHYHVRHGSYWESKNNRYRLQGQIYCLRLAWDWFRKRGKDPAQYGLRRV